MSEIFLALFNRPHSNVRVIKSQYVPGFAQLFIVHTFVQLAKKPKLEFFSITVLVNIFKLQIIFDECHKAKNLVPSGSGKSTKTGKTVLELQNQLPNAR